MEHEAGRRKKEEGRGKKERGGKERVDVKGFSFFFSCSLCFIFLIPTGGCYYKEVTQHWCPCVLMLSFFIISHVLRNAQ